ncbi:MAG: putative regulatory protein associated with the ectoine operon [Puniceicoccaceae bacterium 5H]|nr:MAG: putative regulatory protein associated with the ectoine operon [Puniceicoccaceae bacterium 5H]
MTTAFPNPVEKISAQPAEQDDSYQLRILRAVRRIVRSVDVHSRRLTGLAGVTVPQLLCLLSIKESGSLSVRDLARKVELSPSVVVGIVDRLEANGYLTRTRSQRDRRKMDLELTEAGLQLIRNTPSPLHERLQAGLKNISQLERATIALSLERILELLEPVASLPTRDESAFFIEPITQMSLSTSPEERPPATH